VAGRPEVKPETTLGIRLLLDDYPDRVRELTEVAWTGCLTASSDLRRNH
jgi:hypothetical protein